MTDKPTENYKTAAAAEYNSYLLSKKKKRKYNESTNDSSHCGSNMENEDDNIFSSESGVAV